MAFIDYWIISITVHESKVSLTLQQMREELFLSPNVKLSGMNGMAHIVSEELANDFLNRCRPVLDKRYKFGYEATVQKNSGSSHKSLLNQIERDSAVIKERLRTCNFAPNIKVEVA
jgi:hypothetical protein